MRSKIGQNLSPVFLMSCILPCLPLSLPSLARQCVASPLRTFLGALRSVPWRKNPSTRNCTFDDVSLGDLADHISSLPVWRTPYARHYKLSFQLLPKPGQATSTMSSTTSSKLNRKNATTTSGIYMVMTWTSPCSLCVFYPRFCTPSA